MKTESVNSVAPPPRAPVQPESAQRKRDYLEGFLAGQKEELNSAPGATFRPRSSIPLKSIYDPEIPVDIYELRLIYDVEISADGDATITMTLTTPHCPVAESLPNEVELRGPVGPGNS